MNASKIKNTIKGALLSLGLILLFSFETDAQRFVVVDINQILESVDEYQAAQSELDVLASKWRQDIAQEYDVIKGMYNRYQAEQVLLSDEARRQREDEIMEKEKEVRELQKAKFGPEGALFQKRQELVRPIQDRVYAAIEDYAEERSYDFIFDKSGTAGIIFANPKNDKTEDIINRLK